MLKHCRVTLKANESNYTLLLPTYNRPDDLARLLRFLADQKACFPVTVLDSSELAIQEKNAACVNQLSQRLDLRLERFDSSLLPWEKFWQGVQQVKTDYCSFCADDDLILVPSISPLLDYLEKNPAYSVAHGWYFNFYQNSAFGLTDIVYQGKSIDEDAPLDRLQHLFSHYEALSYGIHRTAILQEALQRMRCLQSMLGRELLGGAIAVMAGKVARLPILYAGRSLGPSASYVHWHPIEFLLSSPQDFFDEYRRYRDLLLKSYSSNQPISAETIRQVDLIHLRYLSEYLKPAVLDHLLKGLCQNLPRQDIIQGIWPLMAQKQGIAQTLQNSALLQKIRRQLFPWVRYYHFKKLFSRGYYRTSSLTQQGNARNYDIYQEFTDKLSPIFLKNTVPELISALNFYE